MNTNIIKKSRWLQIAAICFLFIIVIKPLPIYAETSGKCGEAVFWSLDNGTLTIEGSGAIEDYSEFNYAPWYDVRSTITYVVVKDGVTNIGDMAFYDCTNLVQATLSNTVNRIGEATFLKCNKLETLNIGNSIASIGDYAFKLCTSLKGVNLPNSLQTIGYESFFMCESLTSITIPSSVYIIGDSAFAYCNNLLQAVINATITKLPTWTFYGCDNLVNVTFSSSIREIGNNSFYNCDNLSNVKSSASSDVCEDITNQIKKYVPDLPAVEKINSTTNSSKTESSNSSQKDVIENNNVIISGNIQTNNQSINESNTTVDVIIKNNDAWNEVIDTVDEYVTKNDSNNPVDVNIYVQNDQKVSGDILNEFAGEDLNININFDNSIFTINAKTLNKDKNYKDFKVGYKLEKITDPDESVLAVLGNAQGYYLTLDGNIDFNIGVKIKLDYMGYASLYQKNRSWNLVQTTSIDSNGYVSFYLNSFDRLTKYLLGINVESINQDTIIIPESEYGQYNGLIDEYGNKYEITGVESSWGITIGQFTLILIAVLVFIVSIIGVIMYVLYKRNQMIEENMRRKRNGKG